MDKEKFDFHKKNLIDETKEYVNLRIELTRLLFFEKVADVSSRMILAAIFGVFALIIILFLSIIAWLFLVDLFSNYLVAAAVQLGVYIIIVFLAWIYRKVLIINPVKSYIIKLLYSDDSDNMDGKETE